MSITKRKCTSCREDKLEDDFYKNKSRKNAWCKVCMKKYMAERERIKYQTDPEFRKKR